ncbi:hypothetical protein GmRootV116_20240 [Variovorax sp. V116]
MRRNQTHAVYNWGRKIRHQLPKLRTIKGRREENGPSLNEKASSSDRSVAWLCHKEKGRNPHGC